VRLGIGLGSFLTLDGIVGGSRRAFTYWDGCGSAGDCVSNFPAGNTMDFGAMLQAHTKPGHQAGKIDLHAGAGVRPYTRIVLNDFGWGPAKLTSTVIPGELGASFFMTSGLSLDLLAQGELWLPWKYCDISTGTCTKDLHPEVGWSALAGLTFHIH